MEVKEKRKLSELTFDQLAEVRVRLGRQITLAEQGVSDLKSKREKVDTEFMARFNAQGLQNVKTQHGTPYIMHRSSCSVADWDAYRAWVLEQNDLDFIDRRPNKTMVAAWKESHDGQLPPGLNWSVTAVLGFTKS